MKADFSGVQRIVLVGSKWAFARYLLIDFLHQNPLHFLHCLLRRGITAASRQERKPVSKQISLGLTRRGLQRASVPDHVMACIARKAPAFWAGAELRAAGNLGLPGCSGPGHWAEGFRFTNLDAVVSVHAKDQTTLDQQFAGVLADLAESGMAWHEMPLARALPPPRDVDPADKALQDARWVHFGYRDGLARIGIEGWSQEPTLQQCLQVSRHRAGEFVLGHAPDNGGDPWVAGPGPLVWPEEVRRFFRNGSFGVVQLIRQYAEEFEQYVRTAEGEPSLRGIDIKAKLCGRTVRGRPLAAAAHADPEEDFDYRDDVEGHRCPFGSHVRRMNPRLPGLERGRTLAPESVPDEYRLAHFGRARPLLRRGMPYGPATWEEGSGGQQRGLIGHFFCASIEDQFEHLLGQWADRVPLGSPDRGDARDPFFGNHVPGDGPFEIPQAGATSLELPRFPRAFAQTLGVAYLFYPSLYTLQGIAESSLWGLVDKDGNW